MKCNNPVCQIQWIDHQGKPTPDSNEAIGMAQCRFEDGTVSDEFPICAEHAQRAFRHSNWKVTPFQSFQVTCR